MSKKYKLFNIIENMDVFNKLPNIDEEVFYLVKDRISSESDTKYLLYMGKRCISNVLHVANNNNIGGILSGEYLEIDDEGDVVVLKTNKLASSVKIGDANFDGSSDISIKDIGASDMNHNHDDTYVKIGGDISSPIISTEQGGIIQKTDNIGSSGKSAAVFGDNNIGANYTLVSGKNNSANGEYSYAEGKGNKSYGLGSHVEGIDSVSGILNNKDIVIASHAEGIKSSALVIASHAEGNECIVDFNSPLLPPNLESSMVSGGHAEGINTHAGNFGAHSEGRITNATGDSAHAEGYKTTASGNYSHSEGKENTASSDCTHVGGENSVCDIPGSFVHGIGLNTFFSGDPNTYPMAMFGRYNGDTSDAIFVLGCGVPDNLTNCLRVTSNQMFINGVYNSSGADFAEQYEWKDGNINNEDRRGLFVTNDETKIMIAKPDDYILGAISTKPCLVGNNPEEWNNRWLTDIFGEYITDIIEEDIYETKLIINEETGEYTEQLVSTGKKRKIERKIENPNYNANSKYISRDKRKEYSYVGLHGQIVMVDDGSCKSNSFCKPGPNGIAINAIYGYRVLKRLDETHILINFEPSIRNFQ